MMKQFQQPKIKPRHYLQTVVWLILCAALTACGSNSLATPDTAAQPSPSASTAAKIEPTPPAIVTERVRACDAVQSDQQQETTGEVQPVAVQQQAQTPVDIRFDGATNTIVVRQGSVATLAGVSAALQRPELLREESPGIWLLSANLRIDNGAALTVAAPEVRWFKLRSDEGGFVTVKAIGGKLHITDVCVTSWDEAKNNVDENYSDGRGFILAREGARMDIERSHLHHLGYNTGEAYGVSWRLGSTTGSLIDSIIAYNYFGMYSYEASDLVIRGNEAHHNVLYGFDPHTRSHRLTIENNVAHHNGKHGIILAEECSDSVIRNNTVYNNLHHGIVIYLRSNNNIVENNIAYGNSGQGININESANTVVRNNTVFQNSDAGIGVGQRSSHTQIVNNDIRVNGKDGVVLYSDAKDSLLESNTVRDNARYGLHVKTEGSAKIENNTVAGNTVGVYMNTSRPLPISEQTNRIQDNLEAQVQHIQ
jgi:parallel beta-helix repeat protein